MNNRPFDISFSFDTLLSLSFGTWADFNDCALRMMGNFNAALAAKGDSKRLAYWDCVQIQFVLMYQYNLAWLTASGTSLYHHNLLAYSFLRVCQEIGVLFQHFDVCGKECLPVNEELAKRAGFGLQNTMQYLLRHSK